MTGAVGTYNLVMSSPGMSRPGYDEKAGFAKGFNSTEKTFSGYAGVLKTFQKGERTVLTSEEQLALLAEMSRLTHEPISMDGNTFRDGKLSLFSPRTLLLSLAQNLAKGAQRSAREGDMLLARKYVDALYGIGDHVLSASSPTVEVLESAHHFLGFASRVQVGIFSNNDYVGTAARYRESALAALWKEQISPQISRGATDTRSANDRSFVTVLAQEYRTAWSRIRAGEA